MTRNSQQKNTPLRNTQKQLKERLLITALVSVIMISAMAGLGHLTVQKLGKMNETFSQDALPLFESTLEFEVNAKEMVLSASKYAHKPSPIYQDRIEDSYNDIQEVLPEIVRLEKVDDSTSLYDLLGSLESIYNIANNIVRLTDEIVSIEQRADALLSQLDKLQESLITLDGSIIEGHVEIIKRVNILKSVLIRIEGYHSGQSLPSVNLTSLEESFKSDKIDSDIEAEISTLSKDIIGSYQQFKKLSSQRDNELQQLSLLREHTDDLLDEVIQPKAKQVVVTLQNSAREKVISGSHYILVFAGCGIFILLLFIFVTVREFMKVLGKFFLVMEHLAQGDFSIRFDTGTVSSITQDVRNVVNPTLEKLQALTVIQPYTDTLWQSAVGGLMLVDSNGLISRVNKTMEVLLALNNESLRGKPFLDYFPSIILEDEEQADAEIELISNTGEAIPILISIKPVFSGQKQGVLQGYFCAVTDLRRDVKLKQQLHEQAEGLHAVLDTVTDAIVVINSDSNIILANVKASKLFGYHDEQLLKEHLTLILPQWEWQVPDSDNTPDVSVVQGRDRNGKLISLEISVGALIWQSEPALVLALHEKI